jgi:hypothetical protein
MEKYRANDQSLPLPDMGGKVSAALNSPDGSEAFFLDIWRGRANLMKGKLQNRARNTIILARIDFGGAPHRNPDGEEIPCPHLHLYREGYSDRWAYPAPGESFTNLDDHWQVLQDFMRYCNVTKPPFFVRGLFT